MTKPHLYIRKGKNFMLMKGKYEEEEKSFTNAMRKKKKATTIVFAMLYEVSYEQSHTDKMFPTHRCSPPFIFPIPQKSMSLINQLLDQVLLSQGEHFDGR